MKGQLYLDSRDITIEAKLPSELARIKESCISEHEVTGLQRMGCDISCKEGYMSISHLNPLPFYNRVVRLNTSHIDLDKLINEENRQFTIAINPFSIPRDAEEIIVTRGGNLYLSSIVLGRELLKPVELSQPSYDVVYVHEVSSLTDELFQIFSQFFIKNGETQSQGRERLLQNITKGSHILAIHNKKPIGMIGAIQIGEVASIYSGIVDEKYRTTKILEDMGWRLFNLLIEDGVNFVYMKSRNRAVVYGVKRMFDLEHLYNERLYLINREI
jgi:hypothetical protein